MATPEVTPYTLLQALQNARNKGPVNDPYGLAAAIGSIGKGYDAMNRSIVGANQLRDSNALTDARMSQGYYPAQVAAQVSQYGQQKYNADQHMTMAQAVEEAHAAAQQQGLTAGTPPYELFMRNYLSQHAGYNAAQGAVPAANQALTQIQNDAFAQQFVKKAVKDQSIRRLATEIFQRSADPSMTDVQKKAMAKDAWAQARQHADDEGLQVNIGPDRTITVSNKDGQVQEVDPNITAMALYVQGNKVPQFALDHVDDKVRQAYADLRANQGVAIKEQVANTPKGKAVGPDLHSVMFDELKHLTAQQTALSKVAEPTDATKALMTENSARIQELRKGLYGLPNDPKAIVPDLSQVITQSGGTTPTLIQPNPNYLYGGETGAEPGTDNPEDVESTQSP